MPKHLLFWETAKLSISLKCRSTSKDRYESESDGRSLWPSFLHQTNLHNWLSIKEVKRERLAFCYIGAFTNSQTVFFAFSKELWVGKSHLDFSKWNLDLGVGLRFSGLRLDPETMGFLGSSNFWESSKARVPGHQPQLENHFQRKVANFQQEKKHPQNQDLHYDWKTLQKNCRPLLSGLTSQPHKSTGQRSGQITMNSLFPGICRGYSGFPRTLPGRNLSVNFPDLNLSLPSNKLHWFWVKTHRKLKISTRDSKIFEEALPWTFF